MKKIELTQGQVALVDDIDYEYLTQWKWFAAWDSKKYRAVRTDITNGKKTVRMHREIARRMGFNLEMVDHKDQEPLNNCRYNLRAATRGQNRHNARVSSNNTSGIKGVCFDKNAGKYRAQIDVNCTKHYLGLFDTLEEATTIIKQKRKELVGEFACH